ncbi:porin family protein [uncultured Photobacterium sp.]|uniref:porin family protein n=1 Tax=uncultured Photobacterium sp. TaxID=173973 RepID=UPI00260E5CBA|nr:porin family protein [uncultured Photobacterium sp.]
MKHIKALAILSTLFVASFTQANEVRGFYVGAGAGSTVLNDLDDSLNGPVDFIDVNTKQKVTGQMSVDSDDTTFKLIAGYQINRIIALEAQYTKYGDVNTTISIKHNGQTASPKVTSWAPEALSFSANAGYTFNNGLRPFAILGLSVVDVNQSVELYEDDVNSGIRYGFGLEYTPPMMNRVSVRAGYEADFFYLDSKNTYDLDDFILSSAYVSLSYKF